MHLYHILLLFLVKLYFLLVYFNYSQAPVSALITIAWKWCENYMETSLLGATIHEVHLRLQKLLQSIRFITYIIIENENR